LLWLNALPFLLLSICDFVEVTLAMSSAKENKIKNLTKVSMLFS